MVTHWSQHCLRSATWHFFGGSMMPSQHSQSTGLLCGRPIAFELYTRQLERSESWRGQLKTSAENEFFTLYWSIWRISVCFRTTRSTNWLTYLHCTRAISSL